jgi:hypothetical protein
MDPGETGSLRSNTDPTDRIASYKWTHRVRGGTFTRSGIRAASDRPACRRQVVRRNDLGF